MARGDSLGVVWLGVGGGMAGGGGGLADGGGLTRGSW